MRRGEGRQEPEPDRPADAGHPAGESPGSPAGGTGRAFGQAGLAALVEAVEPVDEDARVRAAQRQLQLTKPPGALGRVEDLGNQLSAISGQVPPPSPLPGLVAVFAADHGVHARGVSPWPQEVTVQMAANIAAGGAGINALAGVAGADVWVVDMGMAAVVDVAGMRQHAVARGTRDMTLGPAMDLGQALDAIGVGAAIADEAVRTGHHSLLTGEVGIANTTAAAALVSVFTGVSPERVTGRGAGSDDAMLAHKRQVVEQAVLANQASAGDPLAALAGIGGFEIAALVGFVLGGARARVPVLLDGLMACAAALVATRLCPAVSGYLVAGHAGAEPGIAAAHRTLGLRPLVEFDLRLGEGTGAALALPVVSAAAAVLREMATFEQAAVSGREQ